MRCRRGVPEEIQSTYGEITTISFSPVHSFKIEEDLPWLQGGKIAVGQFEACLPPETILFFFFFLPNLKMCMSFFHAYISWCLVWFHSGINSNNKI